jgi:hypothetical protein
MTKARIAGVLPFATAVLAACGGSGGDRAAAAGGADTAVARRVWTPDQARALRQARERGEAAPQAAVPVPIPGPSEGEDSARWAAEEKVKYDQRVRSMQPYAECMAQARQVTGEMRARLEAACRNLPTAPR